MNKAYQISRCFVLRQNIVITFLLFQYNGFMKKNKLLFGAVSALLLFGNSVSAEETENSSLYFDFNNDGITDSILLNALVSPLLCCRKSIMVP